ncbi:MAG: hypothetical protein J4F46_08450 [Dehalococcoidia bacterium]|nr:hypothetical protein [Dehalococcoidia bacterium]
MHDGISLESQGIPTATIITHVFERTAQAYTRLLGVSDFPYLVCPHPITGVSQAEVADRARNLVPQVRQLLMEGHV